MALPAGGAHQCQAAYDADVILLVLEQLVEDTDAGTVKMPRLDVVLITLETCLSLSGFYDADECIRYHLFTLQVGAPV